MAKKRCRNYDTIKEIILIKNAWNVKLLECKLRFTDKSEFQAFLVYKKLFPNRVKIVLLFKYYKFL